MRLTPKELVDRYLSGCSLSGCNCDLETMDFIDFVVELKINDVRPNPAFVARLERVIRAHSIRKNMQNGQYVQEEDCG